MDYDDDRQALEDELYAEPSDDETESDGLSEDEEEALAQVNYRHSFTLENAQPVTVEDEEKKLVFEDEGISIISEGDSDEPEEGQVTPDEKQPERPQDALENSKHSDIPVSSKPTKEIGSDELRVVQMRRTLPIPGVELDKVLKGDHDLGKVNL
ncbi:hypothetical protein HKX48_000483 [Thoreauomyces humboldtii]|nr:hypothetical protein HKX48_000483 [Thoreauomyces humboldtii]